MAVEEAENIIQQSEFKNNINLIEDDGKIKFEVKNIDLEKFIELILFIENLLSKNDRIIIKERIIYYKKESSDRIDLSNCIFHEEVKFEKCTFIENVLIKNTIFKNNVSFKESKFLLKIRFHWSKFEKTVDFYNTVFENLVDFYRAEFKETQKFALTDFLDRAIFSNVIFHRQIQFVYNKVRIDSMISFENATFKEALDISRANFWCKVHFWGVKTNNNPKEIWLYQTDNIEQKEILNQIIGLKRIRESFRIIKQSFRTDGNNIEALDFHKNEMIIYQKELQEKNKKTKKEDKIILWFNKNSNLFGTSWKCGLLFTLLTSLFFYGIYLISLSNQLELDWSFNGFNIMVKNYVQFLNLTVWDIKPFGIENYNLGYLPLFIGRIFIGYGYYQTIQAFRKYGKN